ncbi:WD40/YVTN/BNR-like repeat-containing protein [Marinobacterium arenosum]|uniref:WD40/YVTN/BNR-like repeat-containing protein n=1 Tax=Marinobacterium arenosum TaxID=2862496 RepID=UPI001C960DBF|nr:YCF48-related protein [Marinobacterium arenosum]MBY4677761.1 photosystem I reaction center subunit IV [Marinobacterium arenosum]
MRIRTITLLLAWLAAPLVSAQADRLETPAQPSSRAAQAVLTDIARLPQRLVAVGEQGTVLLSDSQGDDWRQAQVPVSVLLTAVSFVDDQYGWAVGHDGVVLHSSDGGTSWQRQLTGDRINQLRVEQLQQALAELENADSPDEEQLERLQYALDDAELAREDGPSVPLLDVWFQDRNTGFVIGGYGLILKTTDSGQSWQSLDHRLPNPDRFHLNSLLADSRGRLWIAGEAGLLLRSDDLGERWQAVDSPYEGSWFAMAEQQGLYLLGLRGHLFHSEDGEDWQPVELAQRATLNGAIRQDGGLWLVGQGGLLLERTADGFVSRKAPVRRSFSAGVASGEQLILVGEGGVSRVAMAAREGAK